MGEVREPLLNLLRQSRLTGEVLELAPGTGYWTAPLSGLATSVTALDGAPEMLRELRARRLPNVRVVLADIFAWSPPRTWDAVFFANWLAHVPPHRFDAFWSTVRAALRPGGVVVCIDVTNAERRIEHRAWTERGVPLVERRANGAVYQVVKTYWEPRELLARLEPLGWTGTVERVGADIGRGFVFYQFTSQG
jgi:demethylmenaquinone methyltransferase/2-methoxy-6-polyprenyl-1,4-benzoquinol methylase